MRRYFSGKWIAVWLATAAMLCTVLVIVVGVRGILRENGATQVTELFQRSQNAPEGWGVVFGDAERRTFDAELKKLTGVQKIGKQTKETLAEYQENAEVTFQAYFTRRRLLTVFVPEEESEEIVLLWKKNFYAVSQPKFWQFLHQQMEEEEFPVRDVPETVTMQEDYSAVSVQASSEWNATVTGTVPWIDGDGAQVVYWSKENPDVQFYFGCIGEHSQDEIPWGYRKYDFQISTELYGTVYYWKTEQLIRYEYVLKSTPGDYTLQYAVVPEKDEAQTEIVLELLQTVAFADGILSRSAAQEIAETECDFPTQRVKSSFDVKEGIWTVTFYHADQDFRRAVEVDSGGEILGVKDTEGLER